MRKIFKVFLVSCMMLLAITPINIVRLNAMGNNANVNDFEYTTKRFQGGKEYVLINKYNGSDSLVNIPDTIDGKMVVNIGKKCFKGNTNIEKVVIPNTVGRIQEEAFMDCTNLNTVIFPYSLVEIHDKAFYNTNLSFASISENTNISFNAFSDMKEGFTVYGLKGSNAEKMATEYNYSFVDVSNVKTKITLDTPNMNIFTVGAYMESWGDYVWLFGDIEYWKEYKIKDISVAPEYMTAHVYFSSSDKSLVSVEPNGKLYATPQKRGYKLGDAYIKIGSGTTTTTMNVEVVPSVSSVWLYIEEDPDIDTLELQTFEAFQLRWEVYKQEGANEELRFYSTDEDVAVVDENGKILAINKGKARIYAEAVDGSGENDWVDVEVENDGEIVKDLSKFESDHNYSNNTDKIWCYKNEFANGIKITFSSKTSVEENFDYIYIYDEENEEVGKFTGDELAGKKITIDGNTVKIRLKTDKQGTDYGFRVAKIEETDFVLEKPTDLDVQLDSYNSLKLSWDEVEHADAYQVYYAKSKTGKYSKAKTVLKATSCIIDGLTLGKKYYFKVRAYMNNDLILSCIDDKLYSSFSSIISGKPEIAVPKVKITDKSYNSVTLKWDSVKDVDRYQVYRNAGNGYIRLATLKSNIKEYKSSELVLGKEYTYKVRAFKKVNSTNVYSDYSDVIKYSSKLDSTKLALDDKKNSNLLSWDKITGATYYQIYRSTIKDGSYTKIKTLNKAYTKFETKKNPTGKYYYKVRGYRTVSGKKVYSAFSNIMGA